jgi:hypothetical protein
MCAREPADIAGTAPSYSCLSNAVPVSKRSAAFLANLGQIQRRNHSGLSD